MTANYAGFGSRLVARLIDAAIFVIPFLVLFGFVARALPKEYRACTVNGQPAVCRVPTGSSIAVLALVALAWFALVIGYYVTRVGNQGATIGQNAMGIKVVDVASGQPIGIGRATGRYFMSVVSSWPCYLGYLWMLWDPRRQTWHDKVVNSIVVKR
jgi:uncharacterized RDD family membrane protein YckC